MREPAFWWRKPGLAAGLLAPAAACYGAIAARRMARPGARAGVPVLCVGNFTLGGAGKTPAVMALAKMLQEAGERPFFLSRGYGGSLAGPMLVDAHTDGAAQVGDEPLLLARAGADHRCARPRRRRAKPRAAAGASVIVMDDGLQNPSLAKDFSFAVVDGRRGLGNGGVSGRAAARAARRAARAHRRAAGGRRGRRAPATSSRAARATCRSFTAAWSPIAAVAALRRARCWPSPASAIRRNSSRPPPRPASRSPQRQPFPDHHRYTRRGSRRTDHAGRARRPRAADHREGPRAHGGRAAAGGARRARARAAGDAGGGRSGRIAARLRAIGERSRR